MGKKRIIMQHEKAIHAVNEQNRQDNTASSFSKKGINREIEPQLANNPLANTPYFDEYLDVFTSSQRVITKTFMAKFAKDLVNWAAKNEDALKISEFYLPYGISYERFNTWKEKDPDLKAAADVAMQLIGNRRERLTLRKVIDANTCNFMMPIYDKQWKEMHEWKAKLKAESEAAENNKQTVIILDKLVPDQQP